LERWCNSIRRGRRERLEIPENHTDVLLQFFQELARIAMNRRVAAFRPVARRAQIPALALDGPGVRKPPVFRPRLRCIALSPIDEQFFAAVEGGDPAGQIVGFDGLLVVGVELEPLLLACRNMTRSVRPPWPKVIDNAVAVEAA
jgi:hypothetical protein